MADMKRASSSVSSLGLMVLLGGSAMPLMAQQTQERERVMIERERSAQGAALIAAHDRAMVEQHMIIQGPHPPGDFVFLGTEMSLGGKLVKGAPYSAQAVTEMTQVLSDGNRIVNKSVAQVFRDSEGRTRREQTIKAIGAMAREGAPQQAIFIHDPVASTSYSLDPKTQIARKLPPMRFKIQGQARAKGQGGDTLVYRDSVQKKELEPDHSGDKYRVAIEGDAQVKRQFESGIALGWLDKNNWTAKTEQLGKQNINGVEADGVRIIVTIAPGEIGNERVIEMISERWFSPELQLIVKTRHFDPRFGENTYQLIEINRTEPARELFEIPAGYKIEETPTYPTKGAVGGSTNIRGNALNGKAISLPTPEYPVLARQAQASGSVEVQVTVDEEGNVISANAMSGHPLLRAAAVTAAQKAKFSPTKLNGELVKVTGVLTYFFSVQ